MSKKTEIQISTPTYQITEITITPKEEVTIGFDEHFIVSPDEGEESSQERTNHWAFTTDVPPSKELNDKFLSLRKYAMIMGEFNDKELPLRNSFRVLTMKIVGQQDLENSRVEFVIQKFIKRTKKWMKMDPGQVVMYENNEDKKKASMTIEKREEMVAAINEVIAEAWAYIEGKNAIRHQLSFRFSKAS